jgi:hypothetical protein
MDKLMPSLLTDMLNTRGTVDEWDLALGSSMWDVLVGYISCPSISHYATLTTKIDIRINDQANGQEMDKLMPSLLTDMLNTRGTVDEWDFSLTLSWGPNLRARQKQKKDI